MKIPRKSVYMKNMMENLIIKQIYNSKTDKTKDNR